MEKHIVTSLFLLLVVALLIRKIRCKEELALIAVAILYPLGNYITDPYLLWTFGWGTVLGFFLFSCLSLRLFKGVDPVIIKKMRWKIPLLLALALNAVGRFVGIEWCWVIGSAIGVVSLVEYKRTYPTWFFIGLTLALFIAVMFKLPAIILSILIVATIYMLQVVWREVSL